MVAAGAEEEVHYYIVVQSLVVDKAVVEAEVVVV